MGAMTPEEIVEAIWAKWTAAGIEWDLEGSTANAEARQLAIEAVRDTLKTAPGEPS